MKALIFTQLSLLLVALTARTGIAANAIAPPTPAPASAPTASATNDITLVPKGTLIVVATRRGYKSYGASTGTKVTYDVVQDVIIDGHVIVKAGDVGEGQVLNAREGSSNFWTGETKGANLRVSLDKIYNFCGDTLEIDFARTEFRNSQGLFGGKQDVEISKGQMYRVPTERPQKVCSERTEATPAPIPSNALEGDKS